MTVNSFDFVPALWLVPALLFAHPLRRSLSTNWWGACIWSSLSQSLGSALKKSSQTLSRQCSTTVFLLWRRKHARKWRQRIGRYNMHLGSREPLWTARRRQRKQMSQARRACRCAALRKPRREG